MQFARNQFLQAKQKLFKSLTCKWLSSGYCCIGRPESNENCIAQVFHCLSSPTVMCRKVTPEQEISISGSYCS